MNHFFSFGLFLFLILGVLSCNSEQTEELTSDSDRVNKEVTEFSLVTLAGKILKYAPELDTLTCSVYGECDCCSGQILFLNDSDFIMIDYCEVDAIYTKGIYKINNQNLILEIDSLAAEKIYNRDKEYDTTGTVTQEYFIRSFKTEHLIKTWPFLSCNNNICFDTKMSEIRYACLDSSVNISNAILELKNDRIIDSLRIQQ